MIKSKILLVFFILILTLGCKTNDENKDRFSNYELISTKKEIIEIKHIKWATTDRPSFVLPENYTKKNDDSLVDYCFYLDTKNKHIQNFSEKDFAKLEGGGTVRVSGKFYKTKKFDAIFPHKELHVYSFTPKNGYFIVFVYDAIL